jgi:hypothetical protein
MKIRADNVRIICSKSKYFPYKNILFPNGELGKQNAGPVVADPASGKVRTRN